MKRAHFSRRRGGCGRVALRLESREPEEGSDTTSVTGKRLSFGRRGKKTEGELSSSAPHQIESLHQTPRLAAKGSRLSPESIDARRRTGVFRSLQLITTPPARRSSRKAFPSSAASAPDRLRSRVSLVGSRGLRAPGRRTPESATRRSDLGSSPDSLREAQALGVYVQPQGRPQQGEAKTKAGAND